MVLLAGVIVVLAAGAVRPVLAKPNGASDVVPPVVALTREPEPATKEAAAAHLVNAQIVHFPGGNEPREIASVVESSAADLLAASAITQEATGSKPLVTHSLRWLVAVRAQ